MKKIFIAITIILTILLTIIFAVDSMNYFAYIFVGKLASIVYITLVAEIILLQYYLRQCLMIRIKKSRYYLNYYTN